MAEVEIVLNGAGVRQLLKSGNAAAIVEAQARRLTRATGMEYRPSVYVGKTRVNASGKQVKK